MSGLEIESSSAEGVHNVTSKEAINVSESSLDTGDSSKVKLWVTELRSIVYKYAGFIGPGLMVSVAYIDPGNYSTSINAGATNQYSLLCIILISNVIAIFLQCLCIKLGSVTGMDLSRNCKKHLPTWLNLILYFFAECAIIATDLAEVIGTAIALNILIKVPLPAGVVLTVIDVLTVMAAYTPGVSSMKFIRAFEYGVALLVVGVVICFAVELAYIPNYTSIGKIFRGFIPSHQMFQNEGMYKAVSILGATVMPHSLFLGSGLVQPRLFEYDSKHSNHPSIVNDSTDDIELEKPESSQEQVKDLKYLNYRPTIDAINYCMTFSMLELTFTLFTLALFVNCSILIIAGATLYGSSEAADADLYTIHYLLSETLAPAAGTIFMLALLLSGQSAGIVCTMAGQIVSEGHLNWKLLPWQRRLATRAISIIPCLIISASLGKEALSKALNASQVVLSLCLPLLVAPLIYFTSSKRIMSVENPKSSNITTNSNSEDEISDNETEIEPVSFVNNWITSIFSILIWLLLSILNVYAIVQLGLSHGNIS
ncbi:hypothetical protein KAFR_0C01670 [Kazachstania africana CBS 2517]|uniref:Uncharacterized protein n=1 Tax=Kazachstania africana (strain ATCC 22294 / BCRC 22015 / CBS 2517 / CECT 1963 / NBRC 1671 / NRRL Y-8276) TaxID=1071382 RepID=H2AS10_KAZAF|nr:hypothetical protein KAFR_0C01670 [Kazachstania africana CBS 2517]CCF57160.1 hypothetical protein KAFR_0C01670 [Kazachstania africana CBS 2517]